MNREILFRGKSVDNGEWIEGNLLRFCWKTDILTYIATIDFNPFDTERTTFRVVPETVGQYTGLCDKNGTKIFEDDIVSFSDYSVHNKGVVCWDINSYWVKCSKSDNEEDEYFAALSYTRIDKIEVIGNIFDNLELLKEE